MLIEGIAGHGWVAAPVTFGALATCLGLVVLTLAGTETQLLSRVTTRSRDALNLVAKLTVQAQIESMALADTAREAASL
jgi:ABC-type molybdate transport system ATPase subunit